MPGDQTLAECVTSAKRLLLPAAPADVRDKLSFDYIHSCIATVTIPSLSLPRLFCIPQFWIHDMSVETPPGPCEETSKRGKEELHMSLHRHATIMIQYIWGCSCCHLSLPPG